jgi:hypothetical protein
MARISFDFWGWLRSLPLLRGIARSPRFEAVSTKGFLRFVKGSFILSTIGDP